MHPHSSPPRALVAALTFLIACTAFAVDVSLPALPSVVHALGGTMAEAQHSVAVFIFGYALGHLPMGMMADRFGRRPILIGGMSLFVFLGLLTATAPDMQTLLFLRFLQGVAAASGPVLSRAVARDVTSGQETVRLMAFLASAMGIAMIVAPAVGTLCLWLFGWRGPYMASALWGGIGLVLCVIYVPETRPGPAASSVLAGLKTGVLAFARAPEARFGAVLAGLAFCGIMGFVTLSPSVFMNGLGLSPTGFAVCFSIISCGYFGGALFARKLADILTALQLLSRIAIGYLVMCCIALLASLVPGLVVPIATLAMLLGLFGATLGLAAAIALKPLGHVAGVAAGCLGTLQLLTGAVFSYVTALYAVDTMAGFLSVLALLALLIAGLSAWFLRAG